jgi:class 3 adenylate cyclase/CHASE2 domain-containing sensor protein
VRRHRYRELTTVGCAIVALVVGFAVSAPLTFDGPLLDVLIWARAALGTPPTSGPNPVAVVAVDSRSLETAALAPYPRVLFAPIWAKLTATLTGAGARAVGFDFLFAYTANRLSPDFDRPFLAALAAHRDRIVLGRTARSLPAPPFLAALDVDEHSLGLTELVADADGVHRHVRRGYRDETMQEVPSLAAALLARAHDTPMPAVVLLTPRAPAEAIPTYALADVLRCADVSPAALVRAFAGRIVLVGSTVPDEDRKLSSARLLPAVPAGSVVDPCGLHHLGSSSPTSMTVPGVHLHAIAIDAVARGRVTRTAPSALVAILTAILAGTSALFALTQSPWRTTGLVLTGAAMLFGIALEALRRELWLPLALPLTATVVTPAVAYVVRYLVEERTRRRIEVAFGRYLSPQIVAQLAASSAALRLGGERREITVMFADLSGFTALSGKVSPEILTQRTNEYLAYIVAAVEDTGGYVDKFLGDAVMAIWGAPGHDDDHAVHAVRAALGAARRVHAARVAAEARGEIAFSVKIGVNSGPAVVGNVGTAHRYNYTAVGETVNVASRLESVPALYGCAVVAAESTALLARREFTFRELDLIRVKGREAPLAIFEPLGDGAIAGDRYRAYAVALTDYRAMRFSEAAAGWSALDDGPAAIMAERARVFAADPPTTPWDGVWALTSK